jgi:HEAT repeat protein
VDPRIGLEALETHLHRLRRKTERAHWERRDQLLSITYSFCELGASLWEGWEDREGMARVASPLALQYLTEALHAANRVGNMHDIITTLLERAEVYQMQQRDHLALLDIERAFHFIEILYALSHHGDDKLFFNIPHHGLERMAAQAQGEQREQLVRYCQRLRILTGLDQFPLWLDRGKKRQKLLARQDPVCKDRMLSLVRSYRNRNWMYSDAVSTIQRLMGDGQLLPALDLLTLGLSSAEVHARSQAAQMLGELGHPEAVPALLHALTTERQAEVKARIIHALSCLRDQRAGPPLCACLASSSTPSPVRKASAKALGQLRYADAVEVLLSTLREAQRRRQLSPSFSLIDDMEPLSETDLVTTCIEALGSIGDGRATGPLCALLREAPDLAEHLIRALQTLGDEAAIGALLAAFEDTSHLEAMLIEACCRLLHNDAASPYLAEIEEAVVSPPSAAVRAGALQILTRLNHPLAASLIPSLLADEDARVRAAAVQALAQRKEEAELLLDQLITLLGEDKALLVREQVAHLFGLLQAPQARDALHQALENDENDQIYLSILIALSQLGDRSVLPLISGELQHEKDEHIRTLLLGTLGNLEDGPMIRRRLLRHLKREKDGATCCALISELARTDPGAAIPTLITLVHDLVPSSSPSPLPHTLTQEGRDRTLIACIDALQDLGDPQVIPVLLDLFELSYKERWRMHEQVRLHVVQALGSFRDERILPPFLAYLEEVVVYARGTLWHPFSIDWESVGAIITSLRDLGHPAAVPVLKQALRFYGENRAQLLEDQRKAYQNLRIEENMLATIEHITGKPIDPQDIARWGWRYAEMNVAVAPREKPFVIEAPSRLN